MSGRWPRLRRSVPSGTLGADARAGLVLGVESVPDGLASGLLAGVNPVSGLYAYMVGTVAGAAATSSVFMSVQATGAMSVVVADVPQVRDNPTAGASLATLGVLTGLVMLGLGLARLGTLVRFVPNAVLVGFINAVAINIVLGQLDNLTGYDNQGANRLVRTLDTLLNISSFDWPSLAIGCVTFALIIVLERTRLGALGLVLAVLLASAAVAVLQLGTVQIVDDIATVPDSLPGLSWPSLSLMGPLIVPALSLAFVGLVQGAGISNSVPNPDGAYPDSSGDFRGQGVANIAAGMLQGMPVGGSMSATSLVMTAGARSRLANVFAGIVMAVAVLLLGGPIGKIAMPSLAALLILIGIRTFKAHQIVMVWRTGTTQATVFAITFVLALVIPLQYAVLTGVAISIVLYVARQSNKVVVRRWVYAGDSVYPSEVDPPATVGDHEVIVLVPYGSLFFAAAPVMEAQLPAITDASQRSVVLIRLRGKDELGSTFINVLTRYADTLTAAGCRLLLVGVGEQVDRQLRLTGAMTRVGDHNVIAATPEVTQSVRHGIAMARAWVDADPAAGDGTRSS